MSMFSAPKPLPGKKKSFPDVEGRAVPTSVRKLLRSSAQPFSDQSSAAPQPDTNDGIASNANEQDSVSHTPNHIPAPTAQRLSPPSKIPVRIKQTGGCPARTTSIAKDHHQTQTSCCSEAKSKIPVRVKALNNSKVPQHLDPLCLEPSSSSVGFEISAASSISHPTEVSKYDEGNCAICLSSHINKSILDCGHVYCFQCLVDWCKIKLECPTCKQPFQNFRHSIQIQPPFEQIYTPDPPTTAPINQHQHMALGMIRISIGRDERDRDLWMVEASNHSRAIMLAMPPSAQHSLQIDPTFRTWFFDVLEIIWSH
uniref:RING-type E3 ubiquitin transferase n=1 Tax=Daphnia galeata TaxID=27404 RepID=A0A8J2W4Z9_9CRUS|nr:unnamed protein product [Daphnia galeata]